VLASRLTLTHRVMEYSKELHQRAVGNIVATLNEELASGFISCLSSFLSALASQSGASVAGVGSFRAGEIAIRRMEHNTVSDPDFQGDQEWVQHLEDAISDIANGQQFDGFDGFVTHVELRGQERTTVIICPIVPGQSLHADPSERIWIFLVRPMALVDYRLSGGMEGKLRLPRRIGMLLSTFFRWKIERVEENRERLNQLEGALFSAASGTEAEKEQAQNVGITAIRAVGRQLIRPVLPVHFKRMLRHLRPPACEDRQDVDSWVLRIDELRDACLRPSSCVSCCLVNRASSVQCPQTPDHDERLRVLAGLEYWRTGFWKLPEPDHNVMRMARRSLSAAASLMRSKLLNNREPILFSEGGQAITGERLLLRHFCATALQQLDARLGTADELVTESALSLEYPAKLASLASTLLGEGRWTPDAIQNLLEVVALYGHWQLGIPQRMDLVRHLQQTLRGESALHTLKTRYRDHFFHTLEVCFLGFALLNSAPDESKASRTFADRLVDICGNHHESRTADAAKKAAAVGDKPPKLPRRIRDREDLMAQWWTAALIHDTAYGIDIHDGTLKLLEFFTNRPAIKDFTEAAKKAVSELGKDLQTVAKELSDDGGLKRGDHGAIAAASLTSILGKAGPKSPGEFEPAIRAIAFHNTRHPKVDAGMDPVAALLILCDTVQEWGRSALRYEHSPAVLLSRLMEASLTPDEEQLGPVKRYGLSLKPVTGDHTTGNYAWEKADELVIELDYGREILKECRAKFMWADMTYNLQRVNYSPWGLKDLRVRVTIPKATGDKKTQFVHFGDFILEQRARFLEPWYQHARAGKPEEAVCYRMSKRDRATGGWKMVHGSDPDARELVEFNLSKLGEAMTQEQPMMGGTIGDFASTMEKWSVYAREREGSTPLSGPPI
jgi:hypothetical protein